MGPPTRPVINGKRGANSNLANLLTRILAPISEELMERVGTEVCNTEELMRAMEDCNNTVEWEAREVGAAVQVEGRVGDLPPVQNMEKMVIFSTDVVALYPSCKKSGTTERIRRALRETELDLDLDTFTTTGYVSLLFKGKRGKQ